MLKRQDALAEQINLSGLVWLLIAQVIVVLPYTSAQVIWIIPALLFSICWRALTLSGRVSQPSWRIKLLLVFLAFGGLAFGNGIALTLHSMVSLLLLSFALKSIETHSRRDALVVVWVAFFLIAARFLFDQSIVAALYGVVSLVCVTTTLIAVQNPNSSVSSFLRLRMGAGMLFTCLPLMLVIFVAAPRLPALWSVPNMSSGPQTGVSDSMTPGDIANLSQSADLAFRAAFKGPRPAQNELYWRGMAMSHFDGKTWRPFVNPLPDREMRELLSNNLPQGESKSTDTSRKVDYELLLEASNQPWLFTLSTVTDITPDALLGFDYRAIADQSLTAAKIYRVTSELNTARDLTLDPWVRELSLQLPNSGNERTRQLAKKMRVESPDAATYIDRVMARYTAEPFHYTLKPPTLGDEDTIDSFLFDSMRGFCAHYAGSFVFMMRAAGIPARVVVGYQGGEWNEEEMYFSVRQFDAHAWTEVWLPERGWIRLDPTARVAPNRVEQNLREAVKDEGSFLSDSPFAMSRYSWLSDVRRGWDATQYRWQKFVINYDSESQLEFLTALLGKLTSTRAALFVGACLIIIGLFWALALGMFRRAAPLPAHQKLYQNFQNLLTRKELPKDRAATPTQQALSASKMWPALADDLQSFVSEYNAICYEGQAASKEKLRRMRKLLKGLYRADWPLNS